MDEELRNLVVKMLSEGKSEEEIGAFIQQRSSGGFPKSPPSGISTIVDKATTPLSGGWFRRQADRVANVIDDPSERREGQHPLKSFGAGAIQGVGDVLDNFTSPADAVAMLSGFGALSMAGRGASSGLKTANTLRRISQAASVPVAYHGAETLGDSDRSLGERAFGLAELAGGAAGMYFPKSALTSRVPKSTPDVDISGNPPVRNPSDPSPDFPVRERKSKEVPGYNFPKSETPFPKSEAPAKPGIGEIVKDPRGRDFVVTGFDNKGNAVYKLAEKADPNLNQGIGDPELAGSTPYRASPETKAKVDELFPGMKREDAAWKPDLNLPKKTSSLPKDLQGAKPRYNIGKESYEPNFSDDLDKALFIIAQDKKSKRDADYLKYVMDSLGVDEKTARSHGQQIRTRIKNELKGQKSGKVTIKSIFRALDDLAKGESGEFDMDAFSRFSEHLRNRKNKTVGIDDLPDVDRGVGSRFPADEAVDLGSSRRPINLDEATDDLTAAYATPVGQGVSPAIAARIRQNATVAEAFDWPDFHPDGRSERMFNVTEGPEIGSTLSETTLRERGTPIPPRAGNEFVQDIIPPDSIMAPPDSIRPSDLTSESRFRRFTDDEALEAQRLMGELGPESAPEPKPSLFQRAREAADRFARDESGEFDSSKFGKRGVAEFSKEAPKRTLTEGEIPKLERWYYLKAKHDRSPGVRPNTPEDIASNHISLIGDIDTDGLTHREMLEWAALTNELKGTKAPAGTELRPYRNEGLPPEEPKFTTYILPDGRRVALDTSATKGAQTTEFTLKGGEIVTATKAPEGTPSFGNPPKREGPISRFMRDESGEMRFGGRSERPVAVPPPPRSGNVQAGQKSQFKRLPGEEQLDPNVPIQERVVKEHPKPGKLQEGWDLARGTMSVDLPFLTSAAFRQASPLAWTKGWFESWGKAARAFGDEATYKTIMNDVMSSEYFKPRYKPQYNTKGELKGYKEMPSIAEELGVKMTDVKHLSSREEAIRSSLAEKLPLGWGKYNRASNRAYTAFLNSLRKSQLEKMMEQAKFIGAENDMVIGKQIAEFINDATGRSPLKLKVGNTEKSIEKSASVLANVLWSPRLLASRIRMITQPTMAMNLDPMVRQEYLKGLFRTVGTWWGFAGLATMAGAEVGMDPTSANFGKIRIGNTRIDPGAGFQQLLVFGARMRPESMGGKFTSSATNKVTRFGEGYKPRTRMTTAEEFAASKLHPMARLVYDLFNASPGKPVHLGDRAVQMALPLVLQDIMEVMKEDPELALIMAPLSSIGFGSQTYGRTSRFGDPVFTDSIENFIGADPKSLRGTVSNW